MKRVGGMTGPEAAKRAAARAALEFVHPERLLGVGSGSTVARFVRELGMSDVRLARAVSTSPATDSLLRAIGVDVVPLESAAEEIDIYVDGADEVDSLGRAVKGGGGAHVREKLVARSSTTWVCIVDDSKLVERLGSRAGVPIEVETGRVADLIDTMRAWGASPRVRPGPAGGPLRTIVDVAGLDLSDPEAVESRLECLPGVVACGIFARRPADIVLVGHPDGSVSALQP